MVEYITSNYNYNKMSSFTTDEAAEQLRQYVSTCRAAIESTWDWETARYGRFSKENVKEFIRLLSLGGNTIESLQMTINLMEEIVDKYSNFADCKANAPQDWFNCGMGKALAYLFVVASRM